MKRFNIKSQTNQLILFVCIFLNICFSNIVSASTLEDSDKVFDWAENFYPGIFPSHQTTQSSEPWLYRYYPETGIYVGTNTNDSGIYVLGGPWGLLNPTYIDSLTSLLKVAESGGSTTSELSSITLPGFPHQIDMYSAAGATKAIVFLHGGGGQNYQFAFNLGINLVDGHPANDTVNWTWLENEKILAIFPQGQAISGVGYTWNNHVTDSGQNDVAFLQTLATYIKGRYGIATIYLAGHSNGGMMANRMWCESPKAYNGYVALSGPMSSYYLSNPCEPSVFQPYYGIAGEMDIVLGVKGNWNAPLWELNPFLVATVAEHLVNSTLIGEWSSYQTRVQLACDEVPADADKISDGMVETWNNCAGQFKLQHVLSGSHSVDSLEEASGSKIIDLIATFLSKI